MELKKINLNMNIGKAKTIKRDINLFDAYRNKSHAGNKDVKSIAIIAICFILLLAVSFGGLKIFTGILKGQTTAIFDQLNAPELQATLQNVNNEVTKNTLLSSYISMMKNAGKQFDEMSKPDLAFFNAVAAATPAAVTLNNMSVTQSDLTLTCSTVTFMDPSLYMQQLEKTGYFANLSFNDVVFDSKENVYTFSVTGLF